MVEMKNIVKTENGAETDGVSIDTDSLVSMNMWGLTPDFLDVLEAGLWSVLRRKCRRILSDSYLYW